MSRWILAAAMFAACSEAPDPDAPFGEGCIDPARGPRMARFADVTGSSGIDFEYRNALFQGAGLAVADLDGDDLPEIVAGRRGGGLALFHNLGALRFEQRTDSGLDGAAAATAIAAIDLDNDGDRDLVIASAGVAVVWANQGGGAFREAAGLADPGTTEHVLPVDLDGDGLLDLYLGDYDRSDAEATRNRLYMNRGGLAFGAAGKLGGGLTWTTTALDIDGDGDLDLYVANDTLKADFGLGGPGPTPPWAVDLLLRNDGPGPDGVPRFTDIAPQMGLTAPRSSMGGVLGDFDGDGGLDLFVPDFGAKKLFTLGPSGYVERAAELGLTATARRNAECDPVSPSADCLVLTWSAVLTDFDLDGYDELLMVNGETSPFDPPPPVLLFTRGAGLPFRELSPDIPCMDARALTATDLDGDGDQDVVIAQRNGPLVIYENRGRPAAASWQRVTLRGQASNREGAGAVVSARMTSGRTQIRIVGAGGVVHSTHPVEAYFGLGDHRVEAIEVDWPSGHRTVVDRPPPGALIVDEDLDADP